MGIRYVVVKRESGKFGFSYVAYGPFENYAKANEFFNKKVEENIEKKHAETCRLFPHMWRHRDITRDIVISNWEIARLENPA